MITEGLSHIKRYLSHWFTAKPKGGFGVHSPFAFHFITNVVEEKHPYYCFTSIEKARANLLRDKDEIDVTDYGTGPSCKKRVCDIASRSLKSARLAQTIFRIALSNHSKEILELGTSLGITTLYLAKTDSAAHITTLEGCPNTARIARNVLDNAGVRNVDIVTGNIDVTLDAVLSKHKTLDLVFFDANHRKQPTLAYFEKCLTKASGNTIFIFDDIHHSSEMEEAWREITCHPDVRVSMDFFHFGVLFFNKSLQKEHYKIRL